MKNLITTILTAILLMAGSCKNNPVIPPEIEPGRRDYVWTVDTIGGNVMRTCALTENNIWVSGEGSPIDRIWYFNGGKWNHNNLAQAYVPTAICGFKTNEIWVTVLEQKLFKYNGTSWIEEKPLKKEGFSEVVIQRMFGAAADNIYAYGYASNPGYHIGIIFHYNGKEWEEVKINEERTIFWYMEKIPGSDKYYLIGDQWTPDFAYANLYEFNGKEIKILYKDLSKKHYLKTMGSVGGNVYFLFDEYLCTYENNEFKKLIKINEGIYNYFGVYGRNEKDIFIKHRESLLHYNGSNIKTILDFENKDAIGSVQFICFDKKIMVFVGYLGTYQKTIIYTGELK